MRRKEILENAIEHTCGDRDVEYGLPKENLESISILWTAYLVSKYRGLVIGQTPIGQFDITAEDVAWLNVLQKISRTFSGNVKADTYEDAAAYSAIAGECAG